MAVGKWDPEDVGLAYVYMALADHMAARIEAGEIPSHARLPGERDLADEYSVAVGTARRAIQELRDRGLVATLPSKGTFVTAPGDRPSE